MAALLLPFVSQAISEYSLLIYLMCLITCLWLSFIDRKPSGRICLSSTCWEWFLLNLISLPFWRNGESLSTPQRLGPLEGHCVNSFLKILFQFFSLWISSKLFNHTSDKGLFSLCGGEMASTPQHTFLLWFILQILCVCCSGGWFMIYHIYTYTYCPS